MCCKIWWGCPPSTDFSLIMFSEFFHSVWALRTFNFTAPKISLGIFLIELCEICKLNCKNFINLYFWIFMFKNMVCLSYVQLFLCSLYNIGKVNLSKYCFFLLNLVILYLSIFGFHYFKWALFHYTGVCIYIYIYIYVNYIYISVYI